MVLLTMAVGFGAAVDALTMRHVTVLAADLPALNAAIRAAELAPVA